MGGVNASVIGGGSVGQERQAKDAGRQWHQGRRHLLPWRASLPLAAAGAASGSPVQVTLARKRLLMREGAGTSSSAAIALAVLRGERAGRPELAEGAGSASGCTAAAALVARPLPRRVAAAAAAAGCSSTTSSSSLAAAAAGVAAVAAAALLRRGVRVAAGDTAGAAAAAAAFLLGAAAAFLAEAAEEGNQGKKQEVVAWYSAYLHASRRGGRQGGGQGRHRALITSQPGRGHGWLAGREHTHTARRQLSKHCRRHCWLPLH